MAYSMNSHYLVPAKLMLLLVAWPCLAQSPADPASADGVFVDRVDVELVDLDVYVTDPAGNPITGLVAGDFEVLEDGRPVTVTNFYAVEKGVASRDVADDPGVSRQTPGPSLPENQRLWLIVYIDNYHLDPLERNRVLPAVRAFVRASVRPGDRAAILSQKREIEVRQPFTDDIDGLNRALNDLEGETGFAGPRERDRDTALRRVVGARSEMSALASAQSYAELITDEVRVTVSALERFVDSLAGLPGRKALVYVASGVPMVPGEELFLAVDGKFPQSTALSYLPRYDQTRAFESLGQRANEHRVAFYTVDAGGLRANVMGTAEHREITTPGLRTTIDSALQDNPQRSLRLMAKETGGEAVLNQNEVLESLERIDEGLDSFYALGFPSSHGGDGTYHRLEVRVNRRGARVRHREGYRSKSLATRLDEEFRAALLWEHQKNPLGVVVVAGELEESDEGIVLPLNVRIPLDQVVFLPLPDGRHETRFVLQFGAIDGAGNVSDIDRVPVGFRISAENLEAARGESFVQAHRLLVGRGRQKVAVAVRDEIGANMSIVSSYVSLGG